MANIVNVKMKYGADIVSVLHSEHDDFVILENPIQIDADPDRGFYAKSWLLLSEENLVTISKRDVFYVHAASDKSIGYYEEFLEKIAYRKTESDEDMTSELEDLFNALIESRESIKH